MISIFLIKNTCIYANGHKKLDMKLMVLTSKTGYFLEFQNIPNELGLFVIYIFFLRIIKA